MTQALKKMPTLKPLEFNAFDTKPLEDMLNKETYFIEPDELVGVDCAQGGSIEKLSNFILDNLGDGQITHDWESDGLVFEWDNGNDTVEIRAQKINWRG